MQSNKKFFEGTTIYVGIDVHARQWHVYATPWPSLPVKPVCMPPNAQGLLTFLENRFPGGTYKSAYEAGFCGFTVHRKLLDAGIDNIVFNPADLKKSQKELIRKTDSVDCRSICENLANGELNPLYIPTLQQESDRELIRGRETVVKEMRRTKHRIAMLLHRMEVQSPLQFCGKEKYWSKAYIGWLRVLCEELDGGHGRRLGSLLGQLDLLSAQIKQYDLDILQVMRTRYAEIGALLKTIPGVGALLSAKICLELMDFCRFEDARKLAGYIGLVPDCKASDQREVIIGTTIRRNNILRTSLIEASWVAIVKDPTLSAAFHKYRASGKQPNVAIISIARKLVNRIFYVYRTKKPYEKSQD